jgi:hypothetical protein
MKSVVMTSPIECARLDVIARTWFRYERVLAARRQCALSFFCGLSMMPCAAPSLDPDIAHRRIEAQKTTSIAVNVSVIAVHGERAGTKHVRRFEYDDPFATR